MGNVKDWGGYPSRDFVTPLAEGVTWPTTIIIEEDIPSTPVSEETPVTPSSEEENG